MDKIKQSKARLQRLEERSQKWPMRWFPARAARQKKRLKDQLRQALHEELIHNDQAYRQLHQKNQKLLEQNRILFKVTDEGASPFTVFSNRFEGSIHANGYLYVKAVRNLNWEGFLGAFHPSSFRGQINTWGKACLKANTTEVSLIGGRVPSELRGSIDTEGNILLKTVKSWWEVDGHVHVTKMMANPFAGRPRDRDEFLSNRREMRRMIQIHKKAGPIKKR